MLVTPAYLDSQRIVTLIVAVLSPKFLLIQFSRGEEISGLASLRLEELPLYFLAKPGTNLTKTSLPTDFPN